MDNKEILSTSYLPCKLVIILTEGARAMWFSHSTRYLPPFKLNANYISEILLKVALNRLYVHKIHMDTWCIIVHQLNCNNSDM